MGSRFQINYRTEAVRKDIPALDSYWVKEIKSTIEEKLASQPELYGKPLRRSLSGYRKLRVGDYRVIFRIEGSKVVVVGILPRADVYPEIEKRLRNA